MPEATVTDYTRAGSDGKEILSPCCSASRVVYHFAWDALTCAECRGEVQKQDWVLADV